MSDHTNDSLEEKRYPVNQKVAFATSTAVAMGLADWVAHFGPTGLVVGGLASYVAWKHGPELYEQMRGVFPRICSCPGRADQRGTNRQAPGEAKLV